MIASLSEEQRLTLASYFMSRAAGERTTALAFSHIVDDFNALPGAGQFARRAHLAEQDELAHSAICRRLAEAHAGRPLAEPLPRATKPATLPDASPSDQRLLRIVFGCCFGETIAVQWLIDGQTACTDAAARRYNRNHIADEVQHSRIGWHLLASDLLRPRDRQMISNYVPLMTQWSRRLWKVDDETTDTALEGFGCPSPSRTRASVEKALNEVILPGLAHHGVSSAPIA